MTVSTKRIGIQVANGKIVTIDAHRSEKDDIAREILEYMADHPNAKDTLDGIVEWWLLERKVKNQTMLVQAALSELVSRGYVLEEQQRDGNKHHYINHGRVSEIRKYLSRTRVE